MTPRQTTKRNIARFPEVQQFIERSAARFPNLKVRWIKGMPPQLVFYTAPAPVEAAADDDDGAAAAAAATANAPADVVPVLSWKMGTIEEFLTEKLEPVSPPS